MDGALRFLDTVGGQEEGVLASVIIIVWFVGGDKKLWRSTYRTREEPINGATCFCPEDFGRRRCRIASFDV